MKSRFAEERYHCYLGASISADSVNDDGPDVHVEIECPLPEVHHVAVVVLLDCRDIGRRSGNACIWNCSIAQIIANYPDCS